MANSDTEEDLSELLDTLSREQLAELLTESLSRKQLAELLLSAATSNSSTRSNVRRAADAEVSHRTLLITGLGEDVTVGSLRRCFSPFGEIERVGIPVGENGQPQGHGFVLFRHLASAKKALREPHKPIGRSTVFCSHTKPARTIYVRIDLPRDFSGLTWLFEFFKQFGEIEEAERFFEEPIKVKIVYETLEGAVRASEEPRKNFQGNILTCEKEKFRGGRTVPQPAPQGHGTGVYLGGAEERGSSGGDQSGADQG